MTEGPGIAPESLHAGFEDQVRRSPEAPAVTWNDRTLTYIDLNRRANRLARFLRGRGVGPETFVGVFQSRSAEMLVSLLAVLKAGGAYVPLDPAYPQARLAFLLQDTHVRVLITEASLRSGLPESPASVVCPDLLAAELGGGSGENLEAGVAPDHLAYVIPTSGSTGRPKCVAIPHRCATALVRWAGAAFSLPELAGVLASTSICFDLSIFEIFVPLCLGGRVVLVDNVLALPRLPAAAGVTLVNTVPSAMTELVRGSGLPSSVRVVNLAGEPLRADLARRIQEHPGIRRVLNLYGPSEDTTYSTICEIARGDERPPAIGRPIETDGLWLLGPDRRPVPAGAEGEIFLAGAGLARGYLGHPDLTADRFVPHPYGGSGERLYRTGDRGRRRGDGDVEFLGRIDQQVKIRGFRIELGEIDATLAALPGVEDCVTVCRDDEAGRRLIAYVVAGAAADAPELRTRLRERLPDYMVPAAFVFLDKLPLTSNGKVDRKALPAPVLGSGDAWTAPRTPTEELLAGIWSSALGVPRVSPQDEFFALGGDSLSAHRTVFQIHEALGVDLTLPDLLSNPTLECLARRLDELRQGARVRLPAVARLETEDRSPASITQHGLWLLDRFQNGSLAFHVSLGLRIHGAVDRAALADAVNALVRRHETLRTRFPVLHEELFQLVEPYAPLPLEQIDLAALPPERRGAEADRWLTEELRRPFSLETEPPLRRLLITCGRDEHLLLLTLHHLLVDGWSLNVLAGELALFYRGFAHGEPVRLPELPLRYADYAVWQRNRLAGELLDRLVTYWRRRLEPPLPVLDLPVDRPRTAPRGTRGTTIRRLFPESLVEELRRLAAGRKATFFLLLLSAFDVLLSRWSGQEDLIVGIPVLNRNHADFENLVGFFVEMLPSRSDLRGDPPFLELLDRTRADFLNDIAHQDLPFETLVETIRPPADPYRPMLFSAMLVLNPPLRRPGFPAQNVAWQFPDTGAAKLELSLELFEDAGRVTGAWEYNRDLFDPATVERLIAHFETLLAGIVGTPGRRLRELPLLTAAETDQLQAWNRTSVDGWNDLCAHQMFELQADREPQRQAARAAAEAATYGDLEARANRLARHLQALGVGVESHVGICLERSLEMVVAMLAVLKSGAAYVPLDPSFPRQRLELMAGDARLAALITQESLAGLCAEFPGRTVRVDADREAIAAHLSSRPVGAIAPEALAYIIYTSGSTGLPKGVCVPHRALADFLRSMRRTPGLSPEDTVLALTTLSFDISGLEILLPLTTGARVVVAPAGAGGDVEGLLPLLAEATVVQATPVTWRLLAEAGWRAEGRRLLCGGEALPRELAERLLAGGAELWNVYGPTETTIWSAADRVVPGEGPVPLGGPIAGTQFHVVDPGQHLLPGGIAGELLIGGAGLARGYLDRPALTAERFVPNPFGEPGSRLYRTGDLVRRRGDRLEFLGRIDHQVKVRGYRIELGEIEAALVRHPEVAAAVVTPWQEGGGDCRLVAYVVPAQAAFSSGMASELRAFLSGHLTEFMLPAAFVPLAALPLTASGKVDRKALPAPGQDRPSIRTAYLAPRDAEERLLCEVWSKVLEVDPIGIDDDFFELGGQSLLFLHVAAQVRSRSGRELSLASLQRASTIRSLAELLRQGRPLSRYNPLVCLQPEGARRPFFCVHGAGGQILRYIPLARALGLGRPFWALQARGLGVGEEPFTTVEEMAACYLAAVREVQPTGPYLLGGYSLGGLIAYDMARRLEAMGERVGFLGLIDMGAEAAASMDSWDDLQVLAFWARLFGLEVEMAALAALPPEGRLESLVEAARAMQRLPADFTVADAQRYLSVHQKTLWATRNYSPGTYGGRVTLFKGEQDADAEDTLGWQRLAAETELLQVTGSHDMILSMPHLDLLAARLRETLDREDP